MTTGVAGVPPPPGADVVRVPSFSAPPQAAASPVSVVPTQMAPSFLQETRVVIGAPTPPSSATSSAQPTPQATPQKTSQAKSVDVPPKDAGSPKVLSFLAPVNDQPQTIPLPLPLSPQQTQQPQKPLTTELHTRRIVFLGDEPEVPASTLDKLENRHISISDDEGTTKRNDEPPYSPANNDDDAAPARKVDNPPKRTAPSAAAMPTTSAPAVRVTTNPADAASRIAAQLAAFGMSGSLIPQDQGNLRSLRGAQPTSSGVPPIVAPYKGPPVARTNLLNSAMEVKTIAVSIPTCMTQSYIVREKGAFAIMLNPHYQLYSEGENRFLLSARRRPNKQTSNYLISLDQNQMNRDSDTYFGKVRANFTGLEFVIYDDGLRPENAQDPQSVRRELGAVLYEANIGGTSGPRKMVVLLPGVNKETGASVVFKPMREDQSIVTEYRKNPQCDGITVLESKQPTWDEHSRTYQLNFHGRVKMPSVKNFQLCDPKQPQRVVMQFGKCEENKYCMDYAAPLTLIQAFGIALSAFDNKLGCR